MNAITFSLLHLTALSSSYLQGQDGIEAMSGRVLLGQQMADGACEEQTIYRPALVVEEPLDNGPFSIAVSFHSNMTAAQRAVVAQAVSEWEAIIETPGNLPNPYPIHFLNASLAAPTVGVHRRTIGRNGLPANSAISFDDDGSTMWFVDPTPASDSEYAPGTTPPAGFDYLTVARHEIGHAMGWTGTGVLSSLVTANTFAPTSWNIAMDPGGTFHADPSAFPDNLMVPGIAPSTRRPIVLYPDATLCARHFDRSIVMKFIDPANGSGPLGRHGNESMGVRRGRFRARS